VIEPGQSTRSAITVAGMSGVSDSSSRTLASNGANDDATGGRSYFGGLSDANARSTVARPMPSCFATRRRGTPSATSRLINAQSSTEITHPICLGGLVFDRRYGLVFKRRRQLEQMAAVTTGASGAGWARSEASSASPQPSPGTC
jgi:hypothetical protein